ncbi:MAG: NAD-dependent epimerase/dehydratase family protein [Deltaproteobacteria bacterium]|nr:NAD-dependent epimerase/dehydratase family protein [Deltaproteobacteria bacterium]
MTCVAVTGSSGYLGRSLLKLLDARAEVEKIIGLDVSAPLESGSKLRFVEHDISRGGLDEIFVREKVERAVHLAFVVNPMRDSRRMREINIGGTRAFLRACDRARVKSLLVASSATAYGAHPDNPEFLREDMPLRANAGYQYATEKVEVEGMVREYVREHPDVDFKIVRPCIIFGPNVSNFMSRLMRWNPIIIIRGSNARFQYIHEEDVARAVEQLVFGGSPGAYNLAGGGMLSVPEQAERIGYSVRYLPRVAMWTALWFMWKLGDRNEIPPGIIPYLRYSCTMDNSRLIREVSFTYRYNSEEAFQSFVEAQKRRRAEKAKLKQKER